MLVIRRLKVLVLFSALFFSFKGTAQTSFSTELGFITSPRNFSDLYVGGGVSMNCLVTDAYRTGISVGVYRKFSDHYANIDVSSNFVPLSITNEYMFLKGKFKPYLGVHLGVLRRDFRVESFSIVRFYLNTAPIVGLEYQFAKNVGLNANLKYNFTVDRNFFLNKVPAAISAFNPSVGLYFSM